MKTLKVSEATELQLDWLVAKCEGYKNLRRNPHRFAQHLIMNLGGTIKALGELNYHESWSLAGPIIEKEKITISPGEKAPWNAYFLSVLFDDDEGFLAEGATPLIAAMRCFVASRLGDTVEVPEELE